MNKKILGIIGIIIVVGIIVVSTYQIVPEEQKQSRLNLLLEKAQTELEKVQKSEHVFLFPLELHTKKL